MPYTAFVSYSQGMDRELAAAIQKALHRFEKPLFRRRALRIFRDEKNIAVTSALRRTIISALDSARYFILLASPESAQSPWVHQEVAWWLEKKPHRDFLIVQAGGAIIWDDNANDFDWEQTTALPSMLKRGI